MPTEKPIPSIDDPAWMQYIEDRYLAPIRAMFADPVAYAAYRARVELALKSDYELRRIADVDALMQRISGRDAD
jgi:hypothetical protein